MNCDNNKLYLYGSIISLLTLIVEAIIGRAYKQKQLPSGSLIGIVFMFFFMLGAIAVSTYYEKIGSKQNGS